LCGMWHMSTDDLLKVGLACVHLHTLS
jgi:hypothetical protein